MKKENSFLSWCWKGSCHDARFSIGDGNIGNCKKKVCNRINVFAAACIFFYPISKDHLCTVTFGFMYGLYSRAASNQERPMMARVRYILIVTNDSGS